MEKRRGESTDPHNPQMTSSLSLSVFLHAGENGMEKGRVKVSYQDEFVKREQPGRPAWWGSGR